MSAVLQRKLDGKGSGAFEELAVEGSRGKEGASWQAMENAEKTQYFSVERVKAKKVSRGCRERKAGRDTRPMAT